MASASELRYLLLSIRPTYANKIFDGSKTIELRRSFPRTYDTGFVVIYVSSPVKAIVGAFQIARIVEAEPTTLWKDVQKRAGLTKREFHDYYCGAATGFAIFIKNAQQFKKSVSLGALRTQLDAFGPPQNFRYLNRMHIERLSIPTL